MVKSTLKVTRPADLMIQVLGGVREAARLLKVSPSTVSRWRSDYNGVIPAKHIDCVYEYSRRKKLGLTKVDLIIGREK